MGHELNDCYPVKTITVCQFSFCGTFCCTMSTSWWRVAHLHLNSNCMNVLGGSLISQGWEGGQVNVGWFFSQNMRIKNVDIPKHIPGVPLKAPTLGRGSIFWYREPTKELEIYLVAVVLWPNFTRSGKPIWLPWFAPPLVDPPLWGIFKAFYFFG